jgi:hypothetical protein
MKVKAVGMRSQNEPVPRPLCGASFAGLGGVLPATGGLLAGTVSTVIGEIADLNDTFTLTNGIFLVVSGVTLNAFSTIWQENRNERRRAITLTLVNKNVETSVTMTIEAIWNTCNDDILSFNRFIKKKWKVESDNVKVIARLRNEGIANIEDQNRFPDSLSTFLREVIAISVIMSLS